jgi:hypothetical protein
MSPSDEMLRAHDIPWTRPPRPRLELLPAADLLALPPGDLLDYAYELQRELQAVRAVLHESVTALARVTKQRDRALEQNRRARDARPPA